MCKHAINLRKDGTPGFRSMFLCGGLALVLLPVCAGAQINRSRPPAPPASGQSAGSSSASQSAGSARRDGGTATGGRTQSLTTRSRYPFDNEVHSYTGPMSPFAYRPQDYQRRARNGVSGPYTGPLSPFMTYQPPQVDRFNYPSGFNRFNQTQEGFQFRYQNGLFGRNQICYYLGWGELFFPSGMAFFPYYYPRFVQGVTTLSPYAFYVGLFPTFMSVNVGDYAPPPYTYVPIPVYVNGVYSGWRRDDVDDYYLNREIERLRQKEERLRQREQELDRRERELRQREENASRPDRDLRIAVDDICRTWTDKNIQLLAKHVRRDVRIAVYLRGKYQYSLDATDYLDITRDALNVANTVKFTLDRIERKEANIYTVSGKHVYRDREGESRTVLVSYVLEKMDGEYIITQIGTAPERLSE
ncbi:MAG: hypothetical protein RMJ43_06790 [Chloroherpetonaceae bacterium]|nr:hypothetical protein [Chthonomonadaceae bacterium]MDW8207527.1 hypothetical protein [Chloroherpetonaceae bacterium]